MYLWTECNPIPLAYPRSSSNPVLPSLAASKKHLHSSTPTSVRHLPNRDTKSNVSVNNWLFPRRWKKQRRSYSASRIWDVRAVSKLLWHWFRTYYLLSRDVTSPHVGSQERRTIVYHLVEFCHIYSHPSQCIYNARNEAIAAKIWEVDMRTPSSAEFRSEYDCVKLYVYTFRHK